MPRGVPNPRQTYGVAALVCLCVNGPNATPLASSTWWASLEEALEADAVLLNVPCGRRCCGRHLVVWRDGDRPRVRHSVHQPPTTTREQDLVACYGQHDPDRHLPPPDPDYNQPLIYAADVLAEWRADDAAMDDADRWLAQHDPELQEAL